MNYLSENDLLKLKEDGYIIVKKFYEINEIIKPPKYGGIIFRPMANDSNKCHPLGLHKGMPVKSGVKYVCNLWIREGVYK